MINFAAELRCKMKKAIFSWLTFLLAGGGLTADAQDLGRLTDSLAYRAEIQTTLGGGDHSPLWLNANRYGLSSVKCNYGYLRGALERPLVADSTRRWGIGYGIDLAVASGLTSTLVVQQAFAEARWLKGVLTIGSKEQPMELKNQELSSGSQTFGINARPVPQVRLSLPDYWTVPNTRNWLALKGHIAYGMQTDDGWQRDFTQERRRHTEHALFHGKAGYLRIGPKNITLEMGLEMACQFGGKSYVTGADGQMEAVENEGGLKSLWHAFVPGGSGSDEQGSTYQNVDGNQLGSWVVRANYDASDWAVGVYLDHYFEDHSSMFMVDYDGYGEGADWNTKKDSRFFLYDFSDMLLGVEVWLKRVAWLDHIVVEYLHSTYQSGPVYHDHTRYISGHLGGIDNYYNHHLYTGWQHWGMVMGNPLYRSPLYNTNGDISVQNNRTVAWHAGLSGQPLPPLHYRLLATYQTGLGTYYNPFIPRRYDLSLLAELSWQWKGGWSVTGGLAMDRGGLLGDNYGMQLTFVKKGLLGRR